MPRILTVSGSLRSGSTNTALLDALALVAPAHVTVTAYRALHALPAFTPDLDDGVHAAPDAVTHWRAALAGADAVVFSSPEYAHGVPGALKNALDWVVGSGELVDMPTGLLNASAASQFAHPQLIEILRVMSARLVPGAVRVVDVPRRGSAADRLAASSGVGAVLREIVAALAAAEGQ